MQPLPSTARFVPIETLIHCDSINPRGETGIATERTEILKAMDKCFLREVLGIRHGPGHSKAKPVDHLLVLFYQFFKCRIVAVPAAFNSPLLIIARDHARPFLSLMTILGEKSFVRFSMNLRQRADIIFGPRLSRDDIEK